MTGDARVVAIGESFHHTHEQLILREHLVRHLVSQLGFNVILLEVITPGSNPIDAFVRSGAGDAESALIAAGARMWRNRETAAVMRWLRQHNALAGARQISVRGLDVLAIGSLMRIVLAHTRPHNWQRLEALSCGFDIDGRADQAAYNRLDPADREMLHRLFAEARTDATIQEPALVVHDALDMLRAGAGGWTEGFALRDAAMANAASRLIDGADQGDKFIILSHNTHIAALASATKPEHPPMGAFLRERYGDDYFVLGTAFGRTEFDPPIYSVAAFAGDSTCADQHVAALGYRVALIDLRGADQGEPLRLQGVGVGPLPYTEYPKLSAFDALAYVDVLTNARQLVETDLSLDVSAVDATRS
jgi:erythromycin esterase